MDIIKLFISQDKGVQLVSMATALSWGIMCLFIMPSTVREHQLCKHFIFMLHSRDIRMLQEFSALVMNCCTVDE